MQRPFYSINLNKSKQIAEILIYGVIGEEVGVEGNSAKQFVVDFQALESTADRINIRINSPGGSVWDGLPIFNAICASQREVHTYIDGIAFSMGAMIALAGHTIHMASGSLLMIHNVSGVEFGNAHNFREMADKMDMYDALFADLIAVRTNQSIDFIKGNWLNYKDNYFSPEDAKKAGLIHVIESYQARNIPTNVRSLNHHQIAAYYQAQHEDSSQSFLDRVITSVKNTLTKKEFDMNTFPKLTALRGIKADEHKPEILEALKAEIAEAKIEGLSIIFDTELKALKQQISDLNLKNNVLSQEVATLIAQLNTVSISPTTPIATADTIHGLESPHTLNFETSFDREIKKSFRQN